jgi:hypothetical protein
MVFGIVGRDAELAAINAFIGEMEGGPLHWCLRAKPGLESRRCGKQASSTRAHGG